MTRSMPLPEAPGPRGVALWHSLRRMRQSALTEYLRLRAQFGDVVRLATRPHPIYLVSHPEAVHYVLRENAHNYRKGLLFKPLAALQGQGLLTSEGDLWARQRRLAQPAFHRQQLATCAEVMVDEARAVVQEWRQPAQTGTLVNVDDRMHRLTFNVVGRVLFGADPGVLDAYRDTCGRSPYRSCGFSRRAPPSRGRPRSGSPPPRNWRFRRAVAVYDALVQQIIAARRQARPHTAGRQRMCSRCCWRRATTRPAPA